MTRRAKLRLDIETREELPRHELGEIAVTPHDERVFFDEYRKVSTGKIRRVELRERDDGQ